MARLGSATVDFDESALLSTVQAAIIDALDAAGEELVAKYRRILNVPYPPASRPGQPPRKRSGQLRRDQHHRIARDSFGVSLIVGVRPSAKSARYAKLLADGTPGGQMRPRPWIDDAEVRAAAVMAQGMVEQSVTAAL